MADTAGVRTPQLIRSVRRAIHRNHMSKVKAALREMDELGCLLWNDAKHLEHHLDNDPARRHYVRAVFAYIEGLVFQLKQVVLARHEVGVLQLTPSEVAMLREETYQLDNDGAPSIRPAYLQVPRNLRFAFSAFARAHGQAYAATVDGPGWHAFRQAIEIRNHLMHPKSVADVELYSEQVKQVAEALEWFMEEFTQLLKLCGSKPTAESPPQPVQRFKRGSKAKAK